MSKRTPGSLERAKNGKKHDPAISKALQRTLKAHLKGRNGKPTDYLFSSQWNSEKPLSRGCFQKWFAATAQAAGLDVAKQHPHAMRHGLGFAMSAAGHNPQTIAQALGHHSLPFTFVAVLVALFKAANATVRLFQNNKISK